MTRARLPLAVLAVTLAATMGTTDARGTAAAGECSKATALEVAKSFFVWGTVVRNPVQQVLCGPFTGPGSEAMAVSFTAPTCWGTQGWAVYRRSGGAWELVTAQRGVFIFSLATVGADIRETTPVFRAGDPRCIPSGGSGRAPGTGTANGSCPAPGSR